MRRADVLLIPRSVLLSVDPVCLPPANGGPVLLVSLACVQFI